MVAFRVFKKNSVFCNLKENRINTKNIQKMMQGELEMTKEEIVMLFLDTVEEFAPDKLEEYISEIKKNSHS